MKYYIIAGEASGDLHASNLMAAISTLDADADFRYWGGDRMQAQGGVLVKHIHELAFMGFAEVLLNIRSIMRNFSLCKKDLLQYHPDVLILVDYPGFNLRMAAFANKHRIRTAYYISPQVWAWKQSRVKKIRQYVDKMLVILPFEKTFYEGFGVDVTFTGHPLLDALERDAGLTEAVAFRQGANLPDKPLIALLPGSRRQEISRILPVMADVAKKYPELHFVVAGLPAHPAAMYERMAPCSNISVVYDQTYALLRHAEAAMVTSGTATLETALFGVPQLVCYKASQATFYIAQRLVKVAYISLVNLIMDKPVVREFIQADCHAEALASELKSLLYEPLRRQRIYDDYRELRVRLGGEGASRRAAEIITVLAKT